MGEEARDLFVHNAGRAPPYTRQHRENASMRLWPRRRYRDPSTALPSASRTATSLRMTLQEAGSSLLATLARRNDEVG